MDAPGYMIGKQGAVPAPWCSPARLGLTAVTPLATVLFSRSEPYTTSSEGGCTAGTANAGGGAWFGYQYM